MLRCPNGLCHVILDAFMAPWRGEDIYIFFFLGSGTQIEGRQNMVSTIAPSLSNILSARRGVR